MIRLRRPSLPADIDADLALAVVKNNVKATLQGVDIPIKESYFFNGVHERTAKGDELSVGVASSAKRYQIKYDLKRDSLYHILPEYLFHPLDRYAETNGDKEIFLKKRKEQKETEKNAKDYFYPFDKIIQEYKSRFQDKLNYDILNNNLFIVDLITEGYTVNLRNRFIRNVYQCILWLRQNRGRKNLMELAIKYAFNDSIHSLSVKKSEVAEKIDDDTCHITLDGYLNDLYCGEDYYDFIETYQVEYQTPVTSTDDIDMISKEIEELAIFFKSWFLSYNKRLVISFGDYEKKPIMEVGGEDGNLFLGYNTQLI